ncbi:meiotic recombination protein SPO11 [Echinococcus multilocularis]|uniref:DNA topoisomerase (ATP-hydrolyzing) n=1 Tax=Echinococcus multilocularis TaxID=6211 RepID=A0A068YED7_ECHMU|nr:meiotic recombination protein SPO11 [Echinococcus multilocularis]
MSVLSSIEELVFQILVVLANRNETSGTDLGLDFLKKYNFRTNRLQVHVSAQTSLFLSIVYKAVKNRSTVTKRSIYYENPRIFLKQAVIDRLLTRTCEYLRINRLDLNTVASSKSIAYGDVWLRGEKDIVFSFKTSREGVSLPSLFLDVNDITCCANFIIVIEKDATFQTIMMSEFYTEYQPCLLITSKGYPDLATRSFLCKLYQKYPKIPIFALVDADPHGFGIYLTYKYGSHNPALKSASGTVLGIPSLKLLGLLPSDTSMLQVKNQDLLQITKSDKLVLRSIKERSYYKEEKKLQFEVSSTPDGQTVIRSSTWRLRNEKRKYNVSKNWAQDFYAPNISHVNFIKKFQLIV